MKKIIITIALLIAIPASAKMLFEYGTFEERADLAVDYGIVQDASDYYGNLDQNLLLLDALEPKLGTSIPSVIAVFETSLASKITSTQTTMTLVSGTTDDSTTLSGTYGFVIDEGSASQEFVLATCADTACTSMSRGISVTTGTSTVDALKKSHRRGASVKITDHPVLATIVRILNGQGTLPEKLTYENTETISDDKDLATKKYIDDVALAAAPDMTSSVKGVSEKATAAEAAANAADGSGDTTAPLTLTSDIASSTSASENLVVVTESDGKIDNTFLNTTSVLNFLTPVGAITAYATTTAPTGWLVADGSEIASTTYSALFAVIGYTYGGTPGGDFNLPNLNGRNIIGYGSATTTIDTMGETGGEDTHKLTADESGLPAHTHTVNVQSTIGGGLSGVLANSSANLNAGSVTTSSTSADASSAHNVLDPFIVLRYIIKY